MDDGPGRELIDRQLGYYAEGDIEGLLRNNYTEDARLVMFDFQVQGKDELRRHFGGFMTLAGKITPRAVERFVEAGDTMLVEITADTEKLGTMVFVDAFVLEGERIAYQFSVVR